MQQPLYEYDPGRYIPFGGGSTHTVLHPLVLAVVIVVGILTFLLPRKYVMVPLFLGLMIPPSTQNLYIAGNHLYIALILISCGLIRMIWTMISSSGAFMPGGFNILDKLFLVWALYRALAGVLLFMQWEAVPSKVSFLWSAVGGYFLFRWLIRDDEDVQRLLKVFAIVAAVAAAGMIFEHVTQQNMFGFLGGIRMVPESRAGRIRAQGMFQHSLLAGAFGAVMFFLFLWLWKRGQSRFFALIGVFSSLVMIGTASTSTPIMAFFGGMLALFLWPARNYMRFIRWGVVVALVALQLVMKQPVWFVMDHIDLVGGSSGYQRSLLVDQFIRHFTDWCLVGTHTMGTWGYDMWDAANQFVAEGEGGGLVCFIAFVAMFVVCFRKIGNARKSVDGDKKKEWLFWLFGVALFAQMMAYLGIDYFDQMTFVWYSLLVMVTVVTMKPSAVTAPVPEASPYPLPRLGVLRPATAVGRSGARTYAPVRKRLSG